MSIGIFTFQIMKEVRDFSKSLLGKVSPQEKFFRVLVYYFITKGRGVILYDEDRFKEYLLSIEVEDTDMYKFLIQRRHEFMSNVEDLVVGRLTKTGN
jgi:hypothetical protein